MEENNLSQLSLTDHDAKLMKMRYGFGVSYNVQTAVDYEESTCDPGSIAPEEIKKCLRAGVIPDVYKEYISDIKIEEKTVFKDVSLEKQIKRYPFSSYDEMLKKASEGYYVRDPEKKLVICPAGKSLYCIGETESGNMRFKNKMACKSCPHKSMCNSNKYGCGTACQGTFLLWGGFCVYKYFLPKH